MCDLFAFTRQYSIAREGAKNHLENIDILLASGYPAIFKFRAAAVGLRNFLHFSEPMPNIAKTCAQFRHRIL